MFKFTDIHTSRKLSEREVTEINFVLKARAFRYIAAPDKSWLYPETELGIPTWDRFGKEHLFMPDPRSTSFGGEIIIGYDSGADFFDAYGRKPWQKDYDDKAQHDREWETFHAFQGEFARKFGPRRRGRSYEFGSMSPEVDSDDYHHYHLGLEQKHKKYRYK